MSDAQAKLLLVDDHPHNLAALSAILRRDDVDLLEARSGPEALETLLKHDVALALIDVEMPGMDGYELAELMRGVGRTRQVPLIFITAGLHHDRRFRGYEAGAVDFLFKPIEPEVIQGKVQVFLELYRQRKELANQRDELQALLEDKSRLLEARQLAAQELEARVQDRTRDLIQSHERLRALGTELNLAEQRERKRLAAELHDHLQQMLVLGKIKLGQGKRLAHGLPACVELIKEVDDVLTDALTYTRTLVAELSPPVLRDHGLAAGLTWLGDYMKKYDLAVTVTVPDTPCLLPEDRMVLLFQSVRELLMNTCKHAGTGAATVTMERDGGILRIAVQDEGCGFDYAAAVASNGDGGQSSKFGLFSIGERMRALGGSFAVDTARGRGTTAVLLLPCLEAHAPDSEPAPPAPAPAGDKKALQKTGTTRVVLVDDHAMVRQGLRSVLDAYPDMEVVSEAADGEMAVSAVLQCRPAVVVMDINMPGMNGIEATAAIKADYPDTVVIGLSVNADERNAEAMKRAGAAMLLTKEAAVEQLYLAIRTAMRESDAERNRTASRPT